MANVNSWKQIFPGRTREGAFAQRINAKAELRRTVLTCLLWEDVFYEKGSGVANRLAELVEANKAGKTYEGLKVTTSDLEILLLLDTKHRLMRLEVPAAKVSVSRD